MFNIKIVHENKDCLSVRPFGNLEKIVTLEDIHFSIVIRTEGLQQWEQDKVNIAVNHWALAFNSPQLRNTVFNYPYFTFTGGRNRQQLYDLLMSGKEAVGDRKEDHIAQVYLRVDRRNRRKIVGYHYRNDIWQYTMGWVFKAYSPVQIANNLCHEYIHVLGLGDSSYSKSQDAVTYVIGRYVERYIA